MGEHAPQKIFISYSHRNTELKDALCAKLRECLDFDFEFWEDSQLDVGSEWFEEISSRIDESNAALLLATKDFFDSDFIKNHELGPFWERWRIDREEGKEVSRPGAIKLIIVPIGEEGTEEFRQSKLSSVQAVMSESLQEDPEEWALEALVHKIRQAIDPTRVAIEDRLAETNQPFVIRKNLGHGHGTRLFLAEATLPPKRDVVVKAIEKASSRWEFYESLRDSADITDLANVVPLYSADLTAVPAHYVTRFVSGGSLAALLEKTGKLQWDRVQQILVKLGRAVESAREKGLLNRFYFDLRPSHILIERWGQIFEPFLSFIGRDTEQRGASLVQHLRELEQDEADKREAFAYILPEQLGMTKGPVVSPEISDAYLLGLMGYHMLTGALPEPPDTANLGDDDETVAARFPKRELFDKESGKEWVEWSDWQYFAVVIEKLIAIDPRDRFPDYKSAMWALEHPKLYTLQRVRDSYKRCAIPDQFFSGFYSRFFERCPEAKPLFSSLGKKLDEGARWRRQKGMVDSAVLMLFSYFAEVAEQQTIAEEYRQDSTILSYFARRHADVLASKAGRKGLKVAPEWFDEFVDSLAESACISDRLSGDDRSRLLLREQWRQVLKPGSDYLKRSHEVAQ